MTFEEGTTEITRSLLLMLNHAEALFGEREKEMTFVGIEFRDDGPYINYYRDKVSIVLSNNCSSNFVQLYFQLSHEVCHFLYPTGKYDANVLNEGVSTYFSRIWVDKVFPNSTYAIDSIKRSKYYDAYLLVEKLMGIDENSIKKIREINPYLSYVTKEEFLSLGFDLEDSEVHKLLEKFKK